MQHGQARRRLTLNIDVDEDEPLLVDAAEKILD
jgi:hypothetical protein